MYKIDPRRKTKKCVLLEALDNIVNGNYDSDSFTNNKRQEDEIQIGSSTFQFDATPFLHKGNVNVKKTNSRRVLVVFKDITEARARERAEKNAQEESMMAKAMGDSMVTLTHELRTPLQVRWHVLSRLRFTIKAFEFFNCSLLTPFFRESWAQQVYCSNVTSLVLMQWNR